MHYKISLVHSGVETEIITSAESASVETKTEGLDTLDVKVSWKLADLREDPAYETAIYTWPGSMSRLKIVRSDNDVLVFDGQIHAVDYDRDLDRFQLSAQS